MLCVLCALVCIYVIVERERCRRRDFLFGPFSFVDECGYVERLAVWWV
jgi:hypothetical protein